MFLKSKQQIQNWLSEHDITSYTLIEDSIYGFKIIAHQIILLSNKNLTEIPVKFHITEEDFYCNDNQLKNLYFAPDIIKKSFFAHNNQLSSLEGLPYEIARDLRVDNNKLKSLTDGPQILGGSYFCSHNQLKSLVGMPQKCFTFDCSNNPIESLKYLSSRINRLNISKLKKLKSLAFLNINNLDYILLSDNFYAKNNSEASFNPKINLTLRELLELKIINDTKEYFETIIFNNQSPSTDGKKNKI